ncbi:MAG TPA: hypothetical protein VNT80_05760 [Acidimicrobiales bacterium]|nr:hypothetical protein [Acidimicrobiales bacterium]
MSDQPRAPLTTTTSIWPAAGVLIFAVVVLLVFMLVNLISDQGVTSTPTTLPVVVGGLARAPSAAVLHYCTSASEIPSNIDDVFLVPVGTSSTASGNIPNAGAGDFDCYQPLVTATNSASLLKFYKSQLEVRGWSLFSQGSSKGSPQSLFQKAGDDGFYWVVGITVTRTTGNQVHWTFRIYQNSETV